MDKQMSDTIKIKINGKDRPMSQAEKITKEIQFSSWEEKLEAEKEVASAKQTMEDENDFPWLLPEEDDSVFKDDPKVVTPSKNKKLLSNQTVTPYRFLNKNNNNKKNVAFPLKKVMTIFFLAIGLGVMFGFIALNFLSNEDMPVAGTPTEVTSNDGAAGNTTDEAREENTKEKAGGNSTATLQLYAVQAGIYKAKAGADTVAANLKEKGFASIVKEIDGNYSVFAGIGKEKTATGALSQIYKQQKFNEIEFWGGKQLSLTISTRSDAKQWATSIQELSSMASAIANSDDVSHENVSEIQKKINGIKATDATEKELVKMLLQAVENIKNKSGWEAQQILLEVMSKISTN